MKPAFLLVACLLAVASPSLAAVGVPYLLSHQGRLLTGGSGAGQR